MEPSSPVRVPTCQEVETRDDRRERQHLYPLEDYEFACTAGGTVRSFCGIELVLSAGTPADAAEATAPDDRDCVTCVDLWLGHRLVRL